MLLYKKAKESDDVYNRDISEHVERIIDHVIKDGDRALLKYSSQYDKSTRTSLLVTQKELTEAHSLVSPSLLKEMKQSADHIRQFAIKQKECLLPLDRFEPVPGVSLGHRVIPVDSCGCYIPGGGYPLYSTALMLVIPAKIAGVERVVACSPTIKGSEKIHPATLVALTLAGADEIYAVGGAQAIAALAYGTQTINPIDIIVGPGNQYVTEAKRQCYGRVGIDFVAGPSEVLIIADETGNANYIAADILAQSEHDLQARGILVTTDRTLADRVLEAIHEQLQQLKTASVAQVAWENNGEIIIADSLNEACQIANQYAPEHLEIHIKDEDKAIELLKNYGSLFIGENAAEVFGDYISGTNHTLPTARAARYTGGVYVGTFQKICTHQKITRTGVNSIASSAASLALAEGLYGHAKAAQIRQKNHSSQ